MAVHFHVADTPISDRRSSDSGRNRGSQLWSKSFRLRYRRLCAGDVSVIAIVKYC